MKNKNEILSNFIPISRKFFECDFWQEERAYSRAEAWLDLIASTRFEESETPELIAGRMVSWTRGELPISLRFLAKRWLWSKNKVDDFIHQLESMERVTRRSANGQTFLILTNYYRYNSGQQRPQQKGQIDEPQYNNLTATDDSIPDKKQEKEGTTKENRADKTNKVNKENNINKEEMYGGANAPAHSQQNQDEFKAFQEWLLRNAPKVARMTHPFTIDEYLRLKKDLSKEQFQDLLLRMQNYRSLLKVYESANLTIRNWAKIDYNYPKTTNNATDEYRRKREEHEKQARKRSME
jgi:hypothetical protein